MTITASSVTERDVEVVGLKLHLQQDGSGPPLLLLHHSTGNMGWLPFYDRLAESFSLTVPDLPGYGQSERPDWAREPRDVAIILQQLLDALSLDAVTVVGLGFGGFLAAEMAVVNPHRLANLVLVGAAGLKPSEGEIVDQMLIEYADYVRQGFRDGESFEAHFGTEIDKGVKDIWDFSRVMTARVTWSPYMFSRRLAPLLGGVQTPTLIVWGKQDEIIPIQSARQYEQALPNARLEIVEDAGHHIDTEQPEELARLIAAHAGSA